MVVRILEGYSYLDAAVTLDALSDAFSANPADCGTYLSYRGALGSSGRTIDAAAAEITHYRSTDQHILTCTPQIGPPQATPIQEN